MRSGRAAATGARDSLGLLLEDARNLGGLVAHGDGDGGGVLLLGVIRGVLERVHADGGGRSETCAAVGERRRGRSTPGDP